ncbi:MAG: hypothetical protein V7746_02185 [Halioglobus sp.]
MSIVSHSLLAMRSYSLLCLALLTIITGCSSDDSSDHKSTVPMESIEPIEILPASTRAIFQFDNMSSGNMPVADEWLAATTSPQQSPVDILGYYTSGVDLAGQASQLILAQSTNTDDGFVVIAKISSTTSDSLFDQVGLVEAGNIQGYPLSSVPDTALHHLQLDDGTLAIGLRPLLEQIVWVHQSGNAEIHSSAIAGHLDTLATDKAYSFVSALPALYKPVIPPGSGDSSLSGATVIKAAFDANSDGSISGSLMYVSDSASTFAANLATVFVNDDIAQEVTSEGNEVHIDLSAIRSRSELLSLLKTLHFDMNAVDYSGSVQHGDNVPWLNFNVGVSPNSIFINFEFTDQEQVAVFEENELPTGFELAPIQILDSDEPRYFLVLNIYQSSGGLVNGARAEWSVFVKDPVTGHPRFLVIQAAAETIAADSVNLFTLPEPVAHELEPDAIRSYVGLKNEQTGEETLYFSSRIEWPQQPEQRAVFSRDFVAANDFIFWGNAVADRGLYNSSVHNREAVVIASQDTELMDNSRWAGYINSTPVHTVVYRNALEIVISPWWNLDADYLDTTEAHLQDLINFKNDFYPVTVQGIAIAALNGLGLVPQPMTIGSGAPTTHFHFVLKRPLALLESLDTGTKLTPIPIALHEGDTADFYLTLAIYERDNDPCGPRAEWLTYVEGDNKRPSAIRLQLLTSEACLDAAAVLALPATVESTLNASKLSIRLLSPFVEFSAQLDLSLDEMVLPTLDWIETLDQVCSVNQVCDGHFYDGQTLSRQASRIDTSGVTIDRVRTPWDDYIQPFPAQVTVRQFPQPMAINPWKNVPAHR